MDTALRGGIDAAYQIQNGGFPGTRGSRDGDEISPGNFEAYPLYGVYFGLPEGVSLMYVLNSYYCHGVLLPPCIHVFSDVKILGGGAGLHKRGLTRDNSLL